ncbi:MAG: DUF2726 domain-containing protein [Rhodothermales bacterium]
MTPAGGVSAHVPIDPERLYQLAFTRRWAAGLSFLHRHHAAVAAHDGLGHAAETFVDALLTLPETSAVTGEVLEKLFLLHTGRLYRLSEAAFEQVVERLVDLHHEQPEAALGYARCCPTNARCAQVIQQYGAPISHPLPTAEAHTVTRTDPLRATAEAALPLFKSQQEVDFFMAVRDVFATYFAYPNVALSALVDFEAIRDRLTGRERRFFFRGLVDCVVFDQHAGYRPVFFFELDSPLHDDPAQQARDRYKDRILALAGQRLYRIRRPAAARGRDGFVALLRELRP